MVKSPRPASRVEEPTTPVDYPEITPPKYAQPTHDFTLQAVMELQKTTAQLSTKVDRLIEDFKDQKSSLDEVRTRISWAMGAAAAVGIIFGFVIALSQLPWSKFFSQPSVSGIQRSQ